MNKLTKASMATAAGIVLLMGGGGSLAVWNDSKLSGATGQISAGTLAMSAPGAGIWKDQKGATVDLATYRVVPGDTLTYTTTIDLSAVGNNLQGTVALGAASISPVSASAADTALAGLLTKSATFTINGAAGSTFTTRAGSQPIVVTATIAWPSGTPTADNAAKNGKVSLANFAVTATQS